MDMITCPECRGNTGLWTGDNHEQWGECRCCNPDGNNRTGKVSERRIMEYRREEAAEAEYWDLTIAGEIETPACPHPGCWGPCGKCGVHIHETAHGRLCQCGYV